MGTIIHRVRTASPLSVAVVLILTVLFIGSMLFVHQNHVLYDRTIAEVTEMRLVDESETIDQHGNEDRLFDQELDAVIRNGEHQGSVVRLTNQYSSSGASDYRFDEGDVLFVNLDEARENGLSGTVTNVKRDQDLLLAAWLFLFSILVVGRKQGLFSVISLGVNAALLVVFLQLSIAYAQFGFVAMASVLAIGFTVISLLFVNGFHPKTYAAIIATLLATLSAMLITFLTIWLTSGAGLHFESMPFVTRAPQAVFLAGIIIGSLGAVMDVAITVTSSMFAIYEKNPAIERKALIASGLEIGKDIMGTMTNILLFVYVSGSIPVLILYFSNEALLGYTLSVNLSLELTRALAGGIGIVLTIPIGLYVTARIVDRKRWRS